MAEIHMKHPRDELDAGLMSAIEARDFTPLDAELTALKKSVDVVDNVHEYEHARSFTLVALESVGEIPSNTHVECVLAGSNSPASARSSGRIPPFSV